jgi:Asp-tRNA(Asn)/Glu-tRNA(Gln) amidotransferase A subunit family amidase
MTIEFESAIELARKIRARKISSRELTDLYIDRIERHDGALNAVVVRDFERARAAAEAADQALAAGRDLGLLHGVPMTIKESYDIAGLPTTWGIPEFRDNIAKTDSAVRRFKEAGAHFMGKTNVPLQLADFQSFNDIYGTTNNPWNVSRTPGGSVLRCVRRDRPRSRGSRPRVPARARPAHLPSPPSRRDRRRSRDDGRLARPREAPDRTLDGRVCPARP